jgi:hypothetical protein
MTETNRKGRFTTCKICKNKFHIKKNNKQKWVDSKYECPVCKQIYCILPETERQLRILENKFLESNKDEKYLNEMYKIFYPYTKSLLLKHFNKAVTCPEDIKYYVDTALSYFIEEYYYKKIDYRTEFSFAPLLLFKLKQTLYGTLEKKDDDLSLNYQLEDGNMPEYSCEKYTIDKITDIGNNFEMCDYLLNMIFSIEEKCSSPIENYLRLNALLLRLEKGESYSDKFFNSFSNWFGKESKFMLEKTLEIIKNEAQNIVILEKNKIEKEDSKKENYDFFKVRSGTYPY